MAQPTKNNDTLALVAGTIAAHLAGQNAQWLSDESRQERIIHVSVAMARAILEATAEPTVDQLPAPIA